MALAGLAKLKLYVLLWVGAILCYAILDTATTAFMLQAGYTELNAATSRLLSFGGIHTVLAGKVLVLFLTAIVWAVWPKPYHHGIPVTVAVLGVVASVNNVLLVIT